MKIFELKCKAYLKTNIKLKNSFDVLSKYLYRSDILDFIFFCKDFTCAVFNRSVDVVITSCCVDIAVAH